MLARRQQYDFLDDQFSQNIPLFEQHLAHLKGQLCRLLEIGSYEGRSAAWLIDNIATHASASIDAIDLNEHPNLRRNLMAAGKATIHIGMSAAVLRTLPFDSYDFVYIDGCHWTIEVLEDAVLAFRLLKAGGIMAFDDYRWDLPGWNQEGRPKEAIDAFLDIYRDKIEVLHRYKQVWLRKKLPTEIVHRKRRSLRWLHLSGHTPVMQPFWLRHPKKLLARALGRSGNPVNLDRAA